MFKIFVLILAAGLPAIAAALPPPLPVSITVIADGPQASVDQSHTRQLIDALAEEGWIRVVPAPYEIKSQQQAKCLTEKEPAACLRQINGQQMALARSSTPHIILLVKGGTDPAQVTCIGRGLAASKPEAQSRDIEIKTALFAPSPERRAPRHAFLSCLLAARAENQ
jgi:hypothetical protein